MARCTKALGRRATLTDMVSGGHPTSSTVASGRVESRMDLDNRYGMMAVCTRAALSKACLTAMDGWSGHLSQGRLSTRAALPRTCVMVVADMFGMMAESTMESGNRESGMAKQFVQTAMAMSEGVYGQMTSSCAGVRKKRRCHPEMGASPVVASAAALSMSPLTWHSSLRTGLAPGSTTKTLVTGTSTQRICPCCLEVASRACSPTSCCQAPDMDQDVTRRQRGAQAPDPWGQPSP
mmetsp:Transcript_54482/g.100766  ORF Transcript_54482/g.100766 Transcript_54482/m.100766 type:complete len:236 (-) Transcript_54482:1500-2207(-)